MSYSTGTNEITAASRAALLQRNVTITTSNRTTVKGLILQKGGGRGEGESHTLSPNVTAGPTSLTDSFTMIYGTYAGQGHYFSLTSELIRLTLMLGQCNFKPSLNSWKSMCANDNSHSKQQRQLHFFTNTQRGGKKEQEKKRNKFGFPIYTDPPSPSAFK